MFRLARDDVQKYLRRALMDSGLIVDGMNHIIGGASRHTWNVDVRHGTQAGSEPVGVILRMDPAASVLASGRHTEYSVYKALGATGVIPVPEALAVEDDVSVLGQTFFAMRRAEGSSSIPGVADPARPDRRKKLFPQAVSVLVELSRLGPKDVPLVPEYSDASEAWQFELNRWEAVIERDELEPQVVTHAAIRWLRRNPPKPADRLALVHGDFRTGNYPVRRRWHHDRCPGLGNGPFRRSAGEPRLVLLPTMAVGWSQRRRRGEPCP